MRPHLTFGSTLRLATIALLGAFTLPPCVDGRDASLGRVALPPGPPTGAPRSRIQVNDVRLRRAAESAVRSASARVEASGCRGLLFEFADQYGRPLAARLASLRMSLQDYVHTVVFVDGSAHPSCQGPVAVTMPGSRVVYVCARLTREPPAEAWVAIVHEVLHSLGLPENPPTPAFISDRVRRLCR